MDKLIFVIILLVLANGFVKGQTSNGKIDDYYIDFAIPDNSASTLLGIAPNKISRPGDVKEIGFQLLNILSDKGNISQGIALEWAPFMTMSENLSSYKKNYILYKMQISFATAKQTDGNGTNLALGYKVTFFDDADPYKNDELIKMLDSVGMISSGIGETKGQFQSKFRQFCDSILKDNSLYKVMINGVFDFDQYDTIPIPSESVLSFKAQSIFKTSRLSYSEKELEYITDFAKRFLYSLSEVHSDNTLKILDKSIAKIKKEFLQSHWNAKALQFSTGIISTSDSSTFKTLKLSRWNSFLGYSQGFGDWGQTILQAQYQRSWKPSDEFNYLFNIGLRILAGTGTFRGSIEGLFSYKTKTNSEIKRNIRSTIGVEFKMSDGLWLETAFGVDTPTNEIKNTSLLTLANLKYTFAKKRRYDIYN